MIRLRHRPIYKLLRIAPGFNSPRKQTARLTAVFNTLKRDQCARAAWNI